MSDADLLPQGPGFRFVTRVLESDEASIVAMYDVPLDAFWVEHHFPGHPVMPGVLIVEALAQAMILHHLRAGSDAERAMFARIEGIRFRRAVRPGETLRLEARLRDARRGIITYACRALVGDEVAASGTLAGLI